jgi:tRNA 2-thiouridine synthesizing protein A
MEKRLSSLPSGAALTVLATDPMAKVDIPLYCRQNGHDCTLAIEGEVMRFSILKA